MNNFQVCRILFLSCILALLTGCASGDADRPRNVGSNFDTTKERAKLVQSIVADSSTSKHRVLILVTYEGDDEQLDDPDITEILQANYIVKLIKVSSIYNEQDAREYWAEKHADGEFVVSFDQYLQMRNGALTYNDLLMLRKLGVTLTPTAMVFDTKGELLDYAEGDQSLNDLKQILLRNISP